MIDVVVHYRNNHKGILVVTVVGAVAVADAVVAAAVVAAAVVAAVVSVVAAVVSVVAVVSAANWLVDHSLLDQWLAGSQSMPTKDWNCCCCCCWCSCRCYCCC